MNKKYVLQEFMNLDYSDDLLTEEEISARLIGAGDITRDEFRLGGGRNWGRSPA